MAMGDISYGSLKMKFITLCLNQKRLLCIDTQNPDKLTLIDAQYYADKYDLNAYASNYKDIFTAKFKRTAGQDSQIYLNDAPVRLSKSDLVAALERLAEKTTKVRKMNPKSLSNIVTAPRFTKECHPVKARLLSSEQLDRAALLRANGCTWRAIGKLIGCNFETVRSGLKRRALYRSQNGE
jgi:hypothetical protein